MSLADKVQILIILYTGGMKYCMHGVAGSPGVHYGSQVAISQTK